MNYGDPSPEEADKLTVFRETLDYRVCTDGDGMRLDAYLALRMPWRKRSSIKKLILEEKVALDGRPPKPSRKVFEGEVIQVKLPVPLRDREIDASKLELDVLYEDDHLLALNKPPGIPVHPSGRLLYRTVISSLHTVYRSDDPKLDIIPKLCHRLDLETSGVLLVAKNDAIAGHVGQQFENRQTKKIYLALVYGRVPQDEGFIDGPIGLAGNSPVYQKMGIRHDVGRAARTRYTVVERLPDYTLLEVEPLTGRRHQIRVHLQLLGFPIVGDKLYGPDENYFLMYFEGCLPESSIEDLILTRQALHAHRLTFFHPRLKETMTLTAPLTEDIQAIVDEQRAIAASSPNGRA